MHVFRVEKRKYFNSILECIPGKVSTFRWNTRGHPILYASQSRSLALHEKCGNMSRPFYGLPPEYFIAIIELPDSEYRKIFPQDLPENWDKIGEYHPKTQEIGDDFTLSEELALFVPSAIIKGEFNVLINPNRAMKMGLTIRSEKIDDRILDL